MWWAWLGIGVAAYAVLLGAVIAVLRAAKSRHAAERAHDAAHREEQAQRTGQADEADPAPHPEYVALPTPDGSSDSC
ncbi:hypothetical protein ACPA54_31305 [Uniformispora flossi]|uniref:hypothetical protein n=1 Tax=Uniformispora flossi TaxID=3390723 RepID=UPI003C2ECCE6